MTITLTPCPLCARHVRADARACPFCERDGGRPRAAPLSFAIAAAGVLVSTSAAAQAALDGGTPDANVASGDAAGLDAAPFDDQEWSRPHPLYGMPERPHGCGCETTHAPSSNEATIAAAALGVTLLARRRRR